MPEWPSISLSLLLCRIKHLGQALGTNCEWRLFFRGSREIFMDILNLFKSAYWASVLIRKKWSSLERLEAEADLEVRIVAANAVVNASSRRTPGAKRTSHSWWKDGDGGLNRWRSEPSSGMCSTARPCARVPPPALARAKCLLSDRCFGTHKRLGRAFVSPEYQ